MAVALANKQVVELAVRHFLWLGREMGVLGCKSTSGSCLGNW